MIVSVIFMSFMVCLETVKGFVNCDQNVTKLQLCKTIDIYDNGEPDWSPNNPVLLLTSVTLIEMAELDEDQMTITMNILLSVVWPDSRISLKSNNTNE